MLLDLEAYRDAPHKAPCRSCRYPCRDRTRYRSQDLPQFDQVGQSLRLCQLESLRGANDVNILRASQRSAIHHEDEFYGINLY